MLWGNTQIIKPSVVNIHGWENKSHHNKHVYFPDKSDWFTVLEMYAIEFKAYT